MKMSPELYKFFCDYQAWLRDGAPEGGEFSRGCGLCTNSILVGLDDQICDFLGRSGYPFGGSIKYGYEQRNATMHLNPERIAFVDRMVAEHVYAAAQEVKTCAHE